MYFRGEASTRGSFAIPVLAMLAALCGSPHWREGVLGAISADKKQGERRNLGGKKEEEEQITLLSPGNRVKPGVGGGSGGPPGPSQDLPHPSEPSFEQRCA